MAEWVNANRWLRERCATRIARTSLVNSCKQSHL
nr:MAG TPA: hypothetical protein [Bacteriophage sp.]DAY91411.1 MAG TPA: hypothetical protein [Caudoviricetes sp.]DAT22342.1 MAG TPA: hypothetical protein [Bacteriophage sp.]DAW86713.1 MAG TPA: hypothetical protein [Bacteriophage sp.]DAX01431.1 MAG TPA: hypothetical protein [Bacteriophage sp.]